MGKYQKGVLGPFSGKVGPVIGSSWNSVAYMRSKGNIVKRREVSDKIANHRARFSFVGSFVKALGELLPITFPQSTSKLTARNAAFTHVMNQALKGTPPDLSIDYSVVQVAAGSLQGVKNARVNNSQPGLLSFSWDDNTGYGNGKAGDKVILIAYSEAEKSCRFTIGDATRSTGTAQLDVKLFSGMEVHTWISFLGDKDDSKVAPSTYTGKVTVA